MKNSHQPHQFHDLPKYCKFLSHSFISSHSIPPHRLSLSGFYYTDDGDCVQCFGVVYNYVTGNATTIHGMSTKSITRLVTILLHVQLICG